MSEVIIDTNVAVVANRQNNDIVPDCVDRCIEFLTETRASHVVLIDEGGEILREYAGALQDRKPYELGALFLFDVLQRQYDGARFRRVPLDKTPLGEFADFPVALGLANFDRSDRKFAALARKTKTAVTNATDSDWADHLVALNANGIAVDFLCGCDKTTWFVR